MSLEVTLTQQVDCAAVVAIAKQACQAILAVYNSEVRRTLRSPLLERPDE